MPKVFISWSGAASNKVATTLYTWLPVVLQSVKPFMSSEDLRKGGRWVADLTDELEKDSYGILCLTPSNLLAPWVLFEAGALSKSVGDSHVAPFLVGVKPSELPPPLTQFNAVHSTKDDFKKLVRAINDSVATEVVAQERIDKAVDACWGQIEAELTAATEPAEEKKATPRDANSGGAFERFDAILQELLTLNRSQSSLLTSPDKLFPRDYLDYVVRHGRGDMPPPGHGVWGDLFESTREVRAVMRHSTVEAPSEPLERLLRAAEYIGKRLDRSRSYSVSHRRWANTETKELEPPPEEEPTS